MKIKTAFVLFMIALVAAACNYERYMQGSRLYEAHCANCHMSDGSGLKLLIPNIAESDYFQKPSDQMFCLLRNGLPATRTDGLDMPAFPQLNTVEMTNLVNYIQHRWNRDFEELKIVAADQIVCE